jgi:hypothetical protein
MRLRRQLWPALELCQIPVPTVPMQIVKSVISDVSFYRPIERPDWAGRANVVDQTAGQVLVAVGQNNGRKHAAYHLGNQRTKRADLVAFGW